MTGMLLGHAAFSKHWQAAMTLLPRRRGRSMDRSKLLPRPVVRRCNRREALVLLGAAAAITAAPGAAQVVTSSVTNPDSASVMAPSDATVEILHGVRIEDPFRPLEDQSRSDVQGWVLA